MGRAFAIAFQGRLLNGVFLIGVERMPAQDVVLHYDRVSEKRWAMIVRVAFSCA